MWSTICESGWNNADARVVCRQLGFAAIGNQVIRTLVRSATLIFLQGLFLQLELSLAVVLVYHHCIISSALGMRKDYWTAHFLFIPHVDFMAIMLE